MPGIYDLMRGIQQQGEEGRSRGLAQLVGKAYAAPQEQRQSILNTVAQRGAPDMAMQAQQGFSKMDETSASDLAREAGMFVALAQSGDEQTIQAAYHRLAQKAQASGHPVPMQYNPSFLPGIERLASAGGSGDDLKSLRVGANGNYWAIRGGQFVDTGTPAAPNTYVRDQPGTPFDILDKRSGQSIYNQQPQPGSQLAPNSTYQTPSGIVRINDVAPEDMAAVEADMRSGGAQDNYALPPRDVSPQGRPPSRPDPSATITPYQQAQLGMQQQRLSAAQDARSQAEAAKKAAEQVKAEQKRQVAAARQAEAATAANTLVSAIDQLMASPGFDALGTVGGDVQIATPLIRNAAKDANAQLQNIGGQVALSTMARLKALSSQGATGFGALSAPELKLLQNAIATLQSGDISNAQLTQSLKTIRDKVGKVATWQPESQGRPAATQTSGTTDPLGIL